MARSRCGRRPGAFERLRVAARLVRASADRGAVVSYSLSPRSRERLRGVHPDLVRVVELALAYSQYDFAVSEGVRSLTRQADLFAKGASMTMRSKHLRQPDGYGHAVDLVAVGDLDKDGDIDAQDRKRTWRVEIYWSIADAMKRAARELGVRIRWGGEFKGNFFDGPHFEMVGKSGPHR